MDTGEDVARCLVVSRDDSAKLLQSREEVLDERARFCGLPAEAGVNLDHMAEPLRPIAPWDAGPAGIERSVEEQTIVDGREADAPPATYKIFKAVPLVVAERVVSGQPRPVDPSGLTQPLAC